MSPVIAEIAVSPEAWAAIAVLGAAALTGPISLLVQSRSSKRVESTLGHPPEGDEDATLMQMMSQLLTGQTGQDTRLAVHDAKIAEQGATIAQQGETLAEQSETLAEQSQKLAEHQRVIAAHDAWIASMREGT